MSNFVSYEKSLKNFNWSLAENELEYSEGDVINIGWYCSDRICLKGEGEKIALYYEGFGCTEKKYTFNDIRLAGNTIGTFLRKLGVKNEDRVCLLMDRIPELYFSFLGILKIGAIVRNILFYTTENSILDL